MQFRAEEYYQAALERMEQAFRIYKGGTDYALAMYCGGLAVECLLRAFRWTKDATFEGRHDLDELLRASKLLEIDDAYMRRAGASEEEIRKSGVKLRAAMNEVVRLWHNNLRFASEASLKAFLKRAHRDRRIKGDPLKKNALDLLQAAKTVVDQGVALWTSKKKS
jgi:HEPN domain-containing protein